MCSVGLQFFTILEHCICPTFKSKAVQEEPFLEETDNLSQGVNKKLPTIAVQHPRRAEITIKPWQNPKIFPHGNR